MKIEVLISTMNKDNVDFVKEMNIKSDIVIGNQNGEDKELVVEESGKKIVLVNSNTKGLSRNRNITLQHATADICLLSDDDLVYKDNYEQIIKDAFAENPTADLIIFNLEEDPVVRYVIKNKMKIGYLNYMRFGSVRIAFKRESIMSNNIRFDTMFGAGSTIPSGEDTIFLHDCLRAKLKVIALPQTILTLTNERESTWFKGYSDTYFINKGKLFERLNKRLKLILCFQDAIRHYKRYQRPMIDVFKLEYSGSINK